MKKITLLILIAGALNAFAQAPLFVNQHPDSVVRSDQRMSRMMHEPGEILVRFHDHVSVNIFKSNGKALTGNSTVDDILSKYDVTEAEKLIKDAAPLKTRQMLRTFTGKEFERPSLHNIYLLKVEDRNYMMFELMEALKQDENVMYAEPNYIYSLTGHEAMSPVLTPADLKEMSGQQPATGKGTSRQKAAKSITPNDPFYNQQWWIQAINADQAWAISTGDTTQVIAILDTGVDWQHPDLQNKIWRNNDEFLNGQDSDGNGFADDIRGWDFINNDNNPMDDNSHGTHVAGIAAAEANNGIGIAGVSWGAKIMPVKVLQSSGYGTSAKIIQGINYAVNNGATVINMSFGSYARSLAMEDALANAYATCVLVAAAGNDETNIGPCFGCFPFYPAAISFVLGVEATQQNTYNGLNTCKLGTYLAGFSNYDCDGPAYSNYAELWNYEIKVPGTTVLSAIPGGNYKVYQGTSMAAPVLAGSVSIFLSNFPGMSQELMWVKLIQSVGNHFNLYNAITAESFPEVRIIEHTIVDTIAGGDGDGRPDAGETLQLWFKLRNTGAQTDSVFAGIRFAPFEDTTTAKILVPSAFIGSISPYATRTNQINPLVIKIDSNVVHDRHIMFDVWTTCYPYQDTVLQLIILNITNATKVQGLINDSVTWYPNTRYLIINSVRITDDGVLVILPGTEVIFEPSKVLEVRGRLYAIGNQTQPIKFFGESVALGRSGIAINTGFVAMEYCKFSYLVGAMSCFNSLLDSYVSNSIFSYNYYYSQLFYIDINFNYNIVKHNQHSWVIDTRINQELSYNLFSDNSSPWTQFSLLHLYSYFGINNLIFINNAFVGNRDFQNNIYNINVGGNSSFVDISNNYWGTIDSINIQNSIVDFYYSFDAPVAVFSPYMLLPSYHIHGHVWKVLVNGADAQDEYVEPVGVGTQRFDVYFNREMDPDYPPQLTFGVRAPYTQHAVADSGYWSEDHKVWTAWKTMHIYTGDGINRIRVAGARDLEGFEIPIEDMRFEFLIDAAGSASIEFTATPGMGKVELEWTYPVGVEDVLGYNIYRFQHITDTTFTQPDMINQTLVLDTLYTDFDVVPGTKYYYYYKILRTNLVETDSSRIVNCIPHTAAPGDANGDYNVNIMDIITIVSFMLNQNPQPFIFEAADINGDGIINVIDITGVIIIINNQSKSFVGNNNPLPAYLYLQDNLIQMQSKGQVFAIQFVLQTDNPEALQLQSLVPGFEFAYGYTEKGIIGIFYNLSGNTFPEGLTNLVSITHQGQALRWGDCAGADPQGRNVKLITSGEQAFIPPAYNITAYPNPARSRLTISYDLPVASEVQVSLYDLFGRKLGTRASSRQLPGNYIHNLDLVAMDVSSGMVLCHIHAQGSDGSHFNKSIKVMVINSR